MDGKLARAAASPESGLARWVRHPDGTVRSEALDRLGLSRPGPRRPDQEEALADEEALTEEELLEAKELSLPMAEWTRSEYESALKAISSQRK